MIAFAAGDKCLVTQNATTVRICNDDKKNPVFSGENKKECRELFDKCSSSQTGLEQKTISKQNK